MKKTLLAAAITLAAAPAFAEIDPIVIEYSPREQLSDSPTSGFTEVFKAKQIQQSNAKSVGEFLAQNASVVTFDNQGTGLAPSIGLRGFGSTASQNTLILVNGIPVNTATLEAPLLKSISLTDVQQIEVRPGSASANYGAGATAGVINILTAPNATGTFEADAGSFGFGQVLASIGDLQESRSYSVSASSTTFDGYRNNTDFEKETASLKYANDSDSNYQNLFVTVDRGEQNTLSGSTLSMLAQDNKGGKTADSFDFDSIIATFSDERNLMGQSLVTSFGYVESNQEGTISGSTLFDQTTRGFRINAEMTVNSGLYYGAELRSDRYDYFSPNVSWGTKKSDSEQRQTSLYLGTQLVEREDLLLSAVGRIASVKDQVRYTHTSAANNASVDETQSASAWNISARKQLNKTLVFRGSLDQAYRFATVDEQQDSKALPNALRPQISNSLHLGIQQQIEGGFVDLEAYHMEISDEIAFQDNPWPNSGNFNVDSTTRTGATAKLSRAISDSTNLDVSMTLLDSEVTGGVHEGKRLPSVAEQTFRFTVEHNLGAGVSTRLSGRFESDKVLASDWNNEGGRVSDQATFDWSIQKKYENFSLKLGVDNLFDAKNYTYGVRGFSTIDGVSGFYDFYIPSLPRSYSFSLTSSF